MSCSGRGGRWPSCSPTSTTSRPSTTPSATRPGIAPLRIFSSTLRSVLRTDDVVARYGGEEFLLVLPDCAETRAHDVLERVRTELALTVVGAGAPTFTASFGLTVAAAEETFEEVVRRADVALLQAKADGRDRVVVSAVA